MNAIADKLRAVKETGEALLRAFTFQAGKGIKEHRQFDKALANLPDPDAVGTVLRLLKDGDTDCYCQGPDENEQCIRCVALAKLEESNAN